MGRRVQVYDAADIAKEMRRTFTDREVTKRTPFRWHWPSPMQFVGESLAVAYSSDKWQPEDEEGRRDRVLYKHLAESRNYCFAVPGAIHDFYRPNEAVAVRGPLMHFEDTPMPDAFAELAEFDCLDLALFTRGTAAKPVCGEGSDGVVEVTVSRAMLGGSKIRWSATHLQPFLFVYTPTRGVMFLIVGEELDVHKEGIVG